MALIYEFLWTIYTIQSGCDDSKIWKIGSNVSHFINVYNSYVFMGFVSMIKFVILEIETTS